MSRYETVNYILSDASTDTERGLEQGQLDREVDRPGIVQTNKI